MLGFSHGLSFWVFRKALKDKRYTSNLHVGKWSFRAGK